MTRIIHIADLHFGDEDTALVGDFLEQLPSHAPDVVVVAGDLTQTGSRREFALAADFLAAIDAPIVLTPGNHDTPLLNIAARLLRPWRRLHKAIGKEVSGQLETGRFHVESFNSARGAQFRLDWSLGVISQRQLAGPMAALRNSEAGLKVLTAHHPILSPLENRGRARTRRAAEFTQEIAETADLVLTGHLHRSFAIPVRTGERQSWFVGASTAFSARTREEPAGFNLIEAGEKEMSLTAYQARARRFIKGPEKALSRT